MDKWPKLCKCLVFDPPIRVIKRLFKKFKAFFEFRNLVFPQNFDNLGQFFNANFSDTPNIILGELTETVVNYFEEQFVIKMLGYSYQGRQQIFLDSKKHVFLDLL